MKLLCALLPILLIYMSWISCDHLLPDKPKSEVNILDELLRPDRYDYRVRPTGIKAEESPVMVNVSIYVLNIHQKDPYLKDFTLQCYFRENWFDPRLASSNISRKVNLRDTSKIWTPDLFIIDEVSSHLHYVTVPNMFVFVHPNGEVLTSFRFSTVIKCRTNMMFFPHDQQFCRIRIESYGSQASELLLNWDPHRNSMFNKNLKSENMYSLIDMVTGKDIIELRMESGKVQQYSRLYVDLLFSRRFDRFLWSLYLPYIMLVMLSWGSFCLPPKYLIPRLSFLLLILILMLHLSPNFHDFRNEIYQVSALDFWVFGCLSFFMAAFLEYMYVYSRISKSKKGSTKSPENDAEEGTAAKKEKVEVNGNEHSMFKDYWKQYTTDADKIDRASRNKIFPITFLIFNIIYWSVCYSVQCSCLEEWYYK